MAGVLYVKAQAEFGSARRDLLDRAETIRNCHIPNPDSPLREPSCKDLMCPAYVANKYSRPNKMKLLGAGRTQCPDLAQASATLRRNFLLLRQSSVWAPIFKTYGAVVHQPWKVAWEHYSNDGFVVHIHVIAEARPGKTPDLEKIRDAHRGRTRIPTSTPIDDFFHAREVEDLEATAAYITKVEKYLPGYDIDKSGAVRDRERFVNCINKIATGHISKQKPRLIERMPVEDIHWFLDATKNSKRLMLGGRRPFRLAGVKTRESVPGWEYR
jgi:hypothetical protein